MPATHPDTVRQRAVALFDGTRTHPPHSTRARPARRWRAVHAVLSLVLACGVVLLGVHLGLGAPAHTPAPASERTESAP